MQRGALALIPMRIIRSVCKPLGGNKVEGLGRSCAMYWMLDSCKVGISMLGGSDALKGWD